MSENIKKNLIGLDKVELAAAIKELGESSFRAKQIWQWIYRIGIADFNHMTNLPASLREKLAESYTLERVQVSKELISFDETRKWLLKFSDTNEIEAVFIPEKTRGTLCVSSQVGCTLNCSFCHTGTQNLVRNLTAGEIVAQVLHAKDSLSDWNFKEENRKLTNIVMMGMGEPLLNYDNVAKALKIVMDPDGLGISKRKITLSTSGIIPLIEKCGDELGVNLAISLHAVRDDLRNTLVPINKKYPIKDLLNACRKYAPTQNSFRKVTFEYVMLKGVNDSKQDAKELVRLIEGIPAKINIIPFNKWPGTEYQCSDNRTIQEFARIVEDAGYMSPIRRPRGQDILAACGQLKSESIKLRKSAT
ncbi:Dual-specificity RNA methyltransferase RlmN [Candidatus Jidaibacter acanthamoeba]|uniref:Dual-specificity RNA methyltransferase RlmN n=1 Tax=Candidatus Jidaibacter acanthamoebae TaxID=86105 RepID=A0A0C1QWC5_9RICK|nr:23S rRNA (adenine(2503)-C(2))-methyltransferase RlmN [Candidatus Jidaibacter acanthamoeba]KIE04315.1 Dual-specificity RNA methyltransferase RlmN [Candidatus Jidaibacter acanthamoeba]